VRKLDDDHWKRNNPETKARAEGLAGQLHDAIAKLEAELAEAEAGKNPQAIAAAKEALETKQSWLKAIGQ
jgi:molecular chaperone DnaK (HSP70)